MRDLYRAWCYNVPFDNMLKLIAHAGDPTETLPGTTAEDFLQSWLDHGAGGTCWASSNALFTVAQQADFQVSRATASMGDLGMPTHGTVIVHLDGEDWILDSSILTVDPLPLARETVHVHPGPLHPVEIEWHDGSFVLWFEAATQRSQFPCRVLTWDVEESVFAKRYEVSRTGGPFNQRLFVRRNFPGRLVMLIGNKRWERTMEGETERVLAADEVVSELTGSLGFSSSVVDRWVDTGGLKAAMEPPTTAPEPNNLERVAPSRRAGVTNP